MSIATPHPEVQESVQYFLRTVKAQGLNDELVASVLRESADLLTKRQPRGGALSDEQVAFLIESGAFTSDEFAGIEAGLARGDLAELERRTRLEAIYDSLSAAEVALRLGIEASSVRHRQAKGGLYSFMAGGRRRYPRWQFTGDPAQPVLPGLTRLAKAFPEGMHPASVKGFMTTPQEDLHVTASSTTVTTSERMTPVEWLLQGGDPQDLVEILDSFLQS